MSLQDLHPLPSALERLLSSLVSGRQLNRGELSAEYLALGDETLWRAAKENRVHALVASRLQAFELALPSRWGELANANRDRVAALVELGGDLFDQLNAAGIRAAVVEGGGTFLASDLPISGYCPSDFDLLVPPCLERAAEVCIKLGLEESDADPLLPNVRRFLKRRGALALRFELVSHPYDRRWIPVDCTQDFSPWLKESTPSSRFPRLRVLKREHAVVNVAMHTSLHSYIRAPGLRLHVDLDWLLRSAPVDWARVVDEAKRLRVRTRVWAALQLAKELLGTPIPEVPLERLAPPYPKQLLLRQLLREGVFGAKPKLGGPRQALLEGTLSDRSSSWIFHAAFPPREWTTSRFDTRCARLPHAYAQRLLKLARMAAR